MSEKLSTPVASPVEGPPRADSRCEFCGHSVCPSDCPHPSKQADIGPRVPEPSTDATTQKIAEAAVEFAKAHADYTEKAHDYLSARCKCGGAYEGHLANQKGIEDAIVLTRRRLIAAVGGKHEGCDYFTLDLTRALAEYANACEHEFPLLARDLKRKVAALRAAERCE